MDRQKLFNCDKGELSLAAGISETAAVLTLSGAAASRVAAPCEIRLDSERIFVGSASYSAGVATCTSLTRGYDGTTAVAHSTAAVASAPLSAAGAMLAAPGNSSGVATLPDYYVPTSSWGDVEGTTGGVLQAALPEAGRYSITANVRWAINGLDGEIDCRVRLYNATDSAVAVEAVIGDPCVVESLYFKGATEPIQVTTSATWYVDVAGPKTLHLQAIATLQSGATSAGIFVYNDFNGRTTLKFHRIA